MSKLTLDKSLVRLSPDEFRKWFEARGFKGESWETHYKRIGGAIKPSGSEKSKSKDK